MSSITFKNNAHMSALTINRSYKSIDLCLVISLLVCLSTLFTKTNPYSSQVNISLMLVYILLAVFNAIRRADQYTWFVFTSLLFVVASDLVFSNFSYWRINDVTYLPFWIINLVFVRNNFSELKKSVFRNRKLYLVTIFLWNFFVLISFFFPTSFEMGSLGKSFISFCGTEHRFAATALFCLAFVLLDYFLNKNRIVLLLGILPIISIFLTNARTYIIVLLFLLFFVVLSMLKKRRGKKFVIAFGLVFLLFAFLYYANAKLKQGTFSWAIEHKGDLYVITSGRSEFWKIDLIEFFKSSPIRLFFGNGSNFIYNVNERYINSRVWAHNDYINVLCANGFFGLFMYSISFFGFLKVVILDSKNRNIKIPFLNLVLFISIIFFNAMFNMVYVYTVASLIIPYLAILMLNLEKRVQNNKVTFHCNTI